MNCVCLHCGKSDAHTNAGALFCWKDHDELTEPEKRLALWRYLGPDLEKRLAA